MKNLTMSQQLEVFFKSQINFKTKYKKLDNL